MIDPLDPDTAVVTSIVLGLNPPFEVLFTVDVDTGAVLTPAVTLADGVEGLAYSLDGSVLYGTDRVSLLTINPGTGMVVPLGNTGIPFVTGLAFRPEDNKFFAIHAFDTDALVEMDPTNGANLGTIGPMGIAGPEGLAFVESDMDSDGVPDSEDICMMDPMAPSLCGLDTDQDGYGNACDSDLNNDGITNGLDSLILRPCYFAGSDPTNAGCDLNCDGLVNGLEFPVFFPHFISGTPPGPSGLPCAGTVPCLP